MLSIHFPSPNTPNMYKFWEEKIPPSSLTIRCVVGGVYSSGQEESMQRVGGLCCWLPNLRSDQTPPSEKDKNIWFGTYLVK